MVRMTMDELFNLSVNIKAIGGVAGPLGKIKLACGPRMVLAMNNRAWETHLEPFNVERFKIFEELAPDGFSADRQAFDLNCKEISVEKRQAVIEAVNDLLKREIEVPIQQIDMTDIDVPDDIPQAEYETILKVFRRVIRFPEAAASDNVVPLKPQQSAAS